MAVVWEDLEILEAHLREELALMKLIDENKTITALCLEGAVSTKALEVCLGEKDQGGNKHDQSWWRLLNKFLGLGTKVYEVHSWLFAIQDTGQQLGEPETDRWSLSAGSKEAVFEKCVSKNFYDLTNTGKQGKCKTGRKRLLHQGTRPHNVSMEPLQIQLPGSPPWGAATTFYL